MRYWTGYVQQYRSNPGNTSSIMQTIRLPPGNINMSYIIQTIQIIQIRKLSCP